MASEKENIYNLNFTPFNTTSRRKTNDIDIEAGDGEQLDSQDSTPASTSVYDNVLQVPNWTIHDFVNERTKFLRQGLDGSGNSAYNDRGSFFYKVFFNFNSNFGLFGSLLKRNNGLYLRDENTAYAYLQNNIDGGKFTQYYKSVLKGKQKSLESFGKILNYLTMECPWFFKEIGGLSSVTKRNFNEITSEKKQITISFNPDAVDMRVSTLLDLYVNACYDTINFKEVIPENLRKFDMAIILFNPPIANLNMEYNYLKRTSGPKFILDDVGLDYESFDTGYDSENEDENKETVHSKNDNNWAGLKGDQMSYKCIILKNCEISLEDLITTPEALSTEEPSNLEFTITINFLRSYIYNINNILNIEMLDNLYNDDEFNQGEFNSSLYNTENKVTILQKTGIVNKQNTPKTDNSDEEPDWDDPDNPYDPDDPDSGYDPDNPDEEEPDWDDPDNPYDPDDPDSEYDPDDPYDEEQDWDNADYPYDPDDPEYDPEEDPDNPLYNPENYPDYEFDEDLEEEPGYDVDNPDEEPDWDDPDYPYDPDDPNNPDNPDDEEEPDWDDPDNPYDPDDPGSNPEEEPDWDDPDNPYDPDDPNNPDNPDNPEEDEPNWDDPDYPYDPDDPNPDNPDDEEEPDWDDPDYPYDPIEPDNMENESQKDNQTDDEIIDDEYSEDYEDDYDWANEEDIKEENNEEEIEETEKLLYFVGEGKSESIAISKIDSQLKATLAKYNGWVYYVSDWKTEYNPETKVYRKTMWYRFKKI